APHGDEFSIALLPGFSGNPRRISRPAAFSNLHSHFSGLQTLESGSNQASALTASSGRIDDSKKSFVHRRITFDRSTVLPISSANSLRLIFMEAVRGKSLDQIMYPPTRL